MKRFLVVRRDNIGDLVCTTPLLTALKNRYPDAWIGALVNSYNAPVLERNPDLDETIVYTKLKHAAAGESKLGLLGRQLGALWKLRRSRLDCVVLATTAPSERNRRLARWLAPRKTVAFDAAMAAAVEGRHEVERVFALAPLLGIEGPVPALRVVPDPAEAERARAAFTKPGGPRIALHISARRPAQRWPAIRFGELARRLRAELGARIMLLWAPGPDSHPQHPGDDAKAREVQASAGTGAATAWPTERLATLIGALAAADLVICPDGGALHLAAALGKPVVALFGDSPPERWRPWGVPHEVLRPQSRDLRDLAVEDVLRAAAALSARPASTPAPSA